MYMYTFIRDIIMGSTGGAEVRTLASHQCNLYQAPLDTTV